MQPLCRILSAVISERGAEDSNFSKERLLCNVLKALTTVEAKKKHNPPQSCYSLLSKYIMNVCKPPPRCCFGNMSRSTGRGWVWFIFYLLEHSLISWWTQWLGTTWSPESQISLGRHPDHSNRYFRSLPLVPLFNSCLPNRDSDSLFPQQWHNTLQSLCPMK